MIKVIDIALNVEELKIFNYFRKNESSNINIFSFDMDFFTFDKSIYETQHEIEYVIKKSIKQKSELNEYFNLKKHKELNKTLYPLHLKGIIDERNLIPVITSYLYL